MSPLLTSYSFYAGAVWIMVFPLTSQEPVVTSIQDNYFAVDGIALSPLFCCYR